MTFVHPRGASMPTPRPLTRRELAVFHAEVARYLAAADVYRSEGCDLRWQPESR
jgi:hypothetical protein